MQISRDTHSLVYNVLLCTTTIMALASLVLVYLLLPFIVCAQEIHSGADAQALCERPKAYELPPEAQPTGRDRARFAAGEDCLQYFYTTIDAKRDLDRTRRCCLVQENCNRELGILFANGWGVKQNYDAATYFLCHAAREMAPAEQWGMLTHVQKMRAGTEQQPLTYCDYAGSGTGSLFCVQQEYQRKEVDWERRLTQVKTKLTLDMVKQLRKLQEAARIWAEKDGALAAEGVQGGTAYPAEALGGQQETMEDFITTLERYVRTRATPTTLKGTQRIDVTLNRVYKVALHSLHPCTECNPNDPSGPATLREAQRAWLAYREAWVRFYQARWKDEEGLNILRREIVTALTATRTVLLRKVPESAR